MIIIIWKQYIEKYYVSDTGLVKNINTNRILKPRKNPNGYLKVNLSINGNIQTVFIHNMVAILFVPNPNNFPLVNHKDGVKINNNFENLEWCTPKYNSNHAKRLGLFHFLQGIECTQSKLTREDVLYLRELYPPNCRLKRGKLTQLSKQFGVSRHTIKNVINYSTYKNI